MKTIALVYILSFSAFIATACELTKEAKYHEANLARCKEKEIPVGENFLSADGCNTCSCTSNGDVACTDKACNTQEEDPMDKERKECHEAEKKFSEFKSKLAEPNIRSCTKDSDCKLETVIFMPCSNGAQPYNASVVNKEFLADAAFLESAFNDECQNIIPQVNVICAAEAKPFDSVVCRKNICEGVHSEGK